MGTIDSLKYVLTQSALDALCKKYYTPDAVYPELPGPNARIRDSPTGKIGLPRFPTSKSCVASTVLSPPLFAIPNPWIRLKIWNDHFFWVDASVFPLVVPWNKTLRKDPPPTPDEFSAEVCDYLADNPAPFRKDGFVCAYSSCGSYQSENRRERGIREGEVPLLELTRDRVVSLAGVYDRGDVAAHDAGNDDVNEGSGDAAETDHAEQSGHVVQLRGIEILADDEAQYLVANKPKKFRKRKTADGASGSGHPPKRLREDHGASGDVGANAGEKSFVGVQELFDQSTLNVEVGITATATMPFVPSSLTPTHEREGGGHVDSVTRVNLRTQPVGARFVVLSVSSHHSGSEVNEPTRASYFADSTSAGNVGPDVVEPSQPVGNDISSKSFYASMYMDSKMLHRTYVPKWDVLNESTLDDHNVCRSLVDQLAPPAFFAQLRAMKYDQLLTEFNVGAARQSCLGAEVRMRLEHALRGNKRLEGQCGTHADLLKEKDSEIADLKERNATLKRQIAALESTTTDKDLSCEELNAKASTLECEKGKLADQATCSGLRNEVSSYKLFTKQIEVVQDVQVKVLSDRVAELGSNLIGMSFRLDEEFCPRFLTTIAGRRWILSRSIKLAVMKCLESPEYMAVLGGAIGRVVEKGMQDGLVAGIDHGKAGRTLVKVSAYSPAAEADYLAAINDLRTLEFSFLAQLESLKDASIADIMDLLHLEGAAGTLEGSQLQPSSEQLMVPIYWLEDQVIILEIPLSFSLDVVHNRVRRLRGDATTFRLSLTDVMVPIIEPLSAKSLTGEVCISGVPAIAATIALSTTFVQASTIPLVPYTKVSSTNIVFEKVELSTIPGHTSAP
ncbi:hypothetical protein Tco_0162365 [Tanacetum coccineum]